MKKQMVVSALIVSLVTLGFTSAQARPGSRGASNNNCPAASAQVTAVDPVEQQKLEAFYQDTLEIRKELVMKQAERQALLSGENPDPAVLSTIAGELFDLRQSLRQSAQEAGLASIAQAGPGRGFGPGNGKAVRGGPQGEGDCQGMGTPGAGRQGRL